MRTESRRIPRDEVAFHPHSFGDPDGRLFRWNGDLLRGISHHRAPFFQRLFEDRVIQRLVEQGLLIDSEMTPLTLDGYAMVVRHKLVPYVSYPEEWCPPMLQDAGIAILDLAIELAKHGLTVKDGHPWNVVFDSSTPVFVDLTSIVPAESRSGWPAQGSFCRFILNPLALMANGHERIARRLLPEYEGVRESEVALLANGNASSSRNCSHMRNSSSAFEHWIPRQYHDTFHAVTRRTSAFFGRRRMSFDTLTGVLGESRRDLQRIKLPSSSADSRHDPRPAVYRRLSEGAKGHRQMLKEVLLHLQPGSLLDIESEDAWVARLAAELGSRTVYFGKDSPDVSRVYFDARGEHLTILPVVMDFVDPTPSRGIDGHWAVAASERLRCDTVVISDAAMRTAWQRGIGLDQIVRGVSVFGRRWLLAEFVARSSELRTDLRSGPRRAYSLDDLLDIFPRHVTHVRVLPVYQDSWVFLLCEI
jgi:hypothetical protein